MHISINPQPLLNSYIAHIAPLSASLLSGLPSVFILIPFIYDQKEFPISQHKHIIPHYMTHIHITLHLIGYSILVFANVTQVVGQKKQTTTYQYNVLICYTYHHILLICIYPTPGGIEEEGSVPGGP